MKRMLLFLLVLLLAACHDDGPRNAIVASGHIEATDVRVATKIGGQVLALTLREGDRLKAGQQIAKIDSTDLELRLQQAEAERDQADADLRLRLAGARKEDIAELEAQLEGARADIAGAQHDLDRMQGLLDRGSGTAKSRDDARTRRDVLASRADSLEQSLARARAGSRKEEIDAARARLASAESRIAQLRQQISDTIIVSPQNGIVTTKLAEQGEIVGAGAPLCVITELDAPWLNVYVSDADLSHVHLGQEATVVTDAGKSRNGKITFISSEAEFTPKNVQTRDERVKLVYKIKISLANADGLFKPGMPAEAHISLSPEPEKKS
ncbi:MAG TPA: efflux RND transporter periplasmic adaptor subunit [Thermoanaerobaculia bacterium]|nr:efflux RND transporter periplasmic adaptor subunit [Thermoanaerobaculia bacterium]